jgi:hypothetical protein
MQNQCVCHRISLVKRFRVTLDVLVVDEFTKAAFQGQLRIPNAKFEDNFNLSFAADGMMVAV